MASFIPRTRPGPDGAPVAWLDTIGHDSVHDYDPLWAECVELGVAPSFHSTGFGHGPGCRARTMSTTTSAISAGPRKASAVRFSRWCSEAVPWAALRVPGGRRVMGVPVLADLVAHYEKRNIDEMHRYDPTRIDKLLLRQLFEEFAVGRWHPTHKRLGPCGP